MSRPQEGVGQNILWGSSASELLSPGCGHLPRWIRILPEERIQLLLDEIGGLCEQVVSKEVLTS